MKIYTIQPIKNPVDTHFPSEGQWAQAEVAVLDQYRWTDHEYHPKCEVRVLYSEENLFLYFHTEEQHFASSRTEDGDEVWKDNCVEFFVSASEDLSAPYMNFEINMIGVMLLGVGVDRNQRRKLAAAEMKSVIRQPDYTEPIVDSSDTLKIWNLKALIPLEFIKQHSGTERPQKGTVWRANFNTCASDVPHPYYGTWNPIETEHPDFHRPEYFGKIVFG